MRRVLSAAVFALVATLGLGTPGPRSVSISYATCQVLASAPTLELGCQPSPDCATMEGCCCPATAGDHSREVSCDACVCVGCGMAVQAPEIVVAPPSQLLRDFPDWNRTFASVPADIAIPPPKLLG